MAETNGNSGLTLQQASARTARRRMGLSAYLNLRAVPQVIDTDLLPARPDGPLIWFILASPVHAAALEELVRRLRQERRDLAVAISGTGPFQTGPRLLRFADPAKDAGGVSRQLGHLRPDLIVFMGGALHPWLIDGAALRGVPLALVDAARGELHGLSWRWWPGVTRGLLEHLRPILAQDDETGQELRDLGAVETNLAVAGRMEEGLGALPYAEAERDALAVVMNARPVWLAVGLPEAEEAAVLAGHREALSLRHRLLLILVPDQPSRGPEIARRLAEDGWDVALRSRDEEPDEEDQIYIADTEGELGLWYRLAPVTYMGGTLSGQDTARHPYEAAALGSAIMHGPKTLDMAPAYARLAGAGGARVLRGAPQLGQTLAEFLAPDLAARMAHNAWEVTSSGAEVTDRVVERLLAAMRVG